MHNKTQGIMFVKNVLYKRMTKTGIYSHAEILVIDFLLLDASDQQLSVSRDTCSHKQISFQEQKPL